MTCPRCKSEIPDNSVRCEVCDKKIRKNKKHKNCHSKKEKKPIPKEVKIKFLIGAIATLLIIFVVIIIAKRVDNNTGLNVAEELKEYIDSPIKVAINETDEYFADESQFDAVNFLCEFDYVIESEKAVEIDGVNYPKWAVFVFSSDDDVIKEIKYVDFKVLKSNPKGVKTDKEINLDKFVIGDRFKTVNKEIKIDPFAISYTSTTVSYDYRYYYENEYDDQQGMTLSVVLDNDLEYIYSTTQRQVPDWIY